jgi:AAA domain, putative AbiEii toxin, Type IV TA system/AAA domain
MRVTRLKLTNVRAIETAEFRFQPGFNLIVGVNGVGKTTVLEALGVQLSAIVRRANGLKANSGAFLGVDIREGSRALTTECSVKIGDDEYGFLIHKTRGAGEGHAAKAGMPREQAIDTPDKAEFVGAAPATSARPAVGGRPLGVFFSTRRAVASTARPSKGAVAGGVAAAFAEAYAHRELRLTEFAEWMRARDALKAESPEAGRVLEAFESATRQFLPGYQRVRAVGDPSPRLVIDRGQLATIPVDRLPDRERAGIREAIHWTDSWMSLNWRPDARLTQTERESARIAAKAVKLADALNRFVPNCENLRPSETDSGGQLIDLRPTTVEIGQLSDGERGALALVLDLTRRLAQANPEMTDPAAAAEAVVLIDEIDLHLHPKWQRQIVRNLTAAFPRCQFIATTHSPQVIGEVEHDRIQIIADGQVYSPTHSLGVDSSRVLEEIMDSSSRNADLTTRLTEISRAIGAQQFAQARELLASLEDHEGAEPDVIRLSTLLDFMEGNE